MSQHLQFLDGLLTSPSLPFLQRLLSPLTVPVPGGQPVSLSYPSSSVILDCLVSSLLVSSSSLPSPPPYSPRPTCCFLIALFCTGSLTDNLSSQRSCRSSVWLFPTQPSELVSGITPSSKSSCTTNPGGLEEPPRIQAKLSEGSCATPWLDIWMRLDAPARLLESFPPCWLGC